MRRTRQQKKPQTRAAEVPPGTSRAPAELQRWTVLKDGPSLGTGAEFEGRSGVSTIPGVEHLLSAALDTTSRRILSDGRTVTSPFLSARGLVSTHLSGGRHSRVSILDSLAGSGRICLALVWLCGHKLAECSGVDTTRRPGGSPALSSIRATHFPNLPDLLIRGSPPLQWCRDD